MKEFNEGKKFYPKLEIHEIIRKFETGELFKIDFDLYLKRVKNFQIIGLDNKDDVISYLGDLASELSKK